MNIPDCVLNLNLPVMQCGQCFWAGLRCHRPYCYKMKKMIDTSARACYHFRKAWQKQRAIDRERT